VTSHLSLNAFNYLARIGTGTPTALSAAENVRDGFSSPGLFVRVHVLHMGTRRAIFIGARVTMVVYFSRADSEREQAALLT